MIAYISGHLDLTESEFEKHYIGNIIGSALMCDSFVIGDAKGTDLLAQKYLIMNGIDPDKVTIYHMLDKPRNTQLGYKLKGGFKSDEERDAAMTAASDYDIAWVRPGREQSGTANNLIRRKKC